MKQFTPSDLIGIKALQVKDLVDWVEAHGWKRTAHPNEKVFVFADPLPDTEPPLMIVIPRHTGFLDTYQRFAETIQTLAQYYDRSPQVILQEVNGQRPRQLPGNGARASKKPTPKTRRSKPQKSRNPKSQRSTQ